MRRTCRSAPHRSRRLAAPLKQQVCCCGGRCNRPLMAIISGFGTVCMVLDAANVVHMDRVMQHCH